MTAEYCTIYIHNGKGMCQLYFSTSTSSATIKVCQPHGETWLAAEPVVTYPSTPELASIAAKDPSLIHHGPDDELVCVPLKKGEISALSEESPNFEEFLRKLARSPGCVCTPNPEKSATERLLHALPDLEDFDITCPSLPCNRHPRAACVSLWNLLIHLNDDHQWTREAIADWLEKTAEENSLDLSFVVPESCDRSDNQV